MTLFHNYLLRILFVHYTGQSYKIKRSGIPIAEQSQPEPPPVPDFLTLQEMEAIDPYEFPVIYILIYNSSKKYLPPNSIV